MREAIEEILRRQQPTAPAEAPTSSQMLFPTLAGETEADQLPSEAGSGLSPPQALDTMTARLGLGGVDLPGFSAFRRSALYPLGSGGSNSPDSLQRGYLTAPPPQMLRTAATSTPSIPVPSLLPPVFIPGTPENNAFSRDFADALQGIAGLVVPQKGAQSRPGNDDDECEELYQRDLTNCKIVKAVKGAGAASQCYQSANQRNFECRQYGPGGVRKPLYGW